MITAKLTSKRLISAKLTRLWDYVVPTDNPSAQTLSLDDAANLSLDDANNISLEDSLT